MPPSVICPDTWPVMWGVTLLSPAACFTVVLMFLVGIIVLCSAFSWGRSFVDAAMRVPRFQLLVVAALLIASLVSLVLLVQWPVTYANNVGFLNFFGVAAAAAFPLSVFTAAATDALWAGEATHIGKAEEKDTCKGVKLVTFQMFAPQVNVWEGSAAATVYSATQVSQLAAAALSGAFVGVTLFSFYCALATGCVSGLSYYLYSVGILVAVGCSCYARGILEVVRCGGCEPPQHSRGLVLELRVQRFACTAEIAVRARSAFFGLITLVGLIVEISHGIMGLLGITTSGISGEEIIVLP